MSEFDSEDRRERMLGTTSGGLAPGEPGERDDIHSEQLRAMTRSVSDEIEDLREAMRFFGADSVEFRRRLDRVLAEYDAVRRRYQIARDQVSDAERQNERLVATLQEAKQQIELLREEVDKLCAPPNSYAVFQRSNKDGTAEIVYDGKPMRVNLHPNLVPGPRRDHLARRPARRRPRHRPRPHG
jgi:hypothetical protein